MHEFEQAAESEKDWMIMPVLELPEGSIMFHRRAIADFVFPGAARQMIEEAERLASEEEE